VNILHHVRKMNFLAKGNIPIQGNLISEINPSNPMLDMTESVGNIQVILGPMFSGKSTELIRRIRRYVISKKKCIVIKYEKDIRYENENLSTHDLITWKAVPCSKLSDVEDLVFEFDVIGIDEGQFYLDVAEFCEKMANLGKIMIVAALDGTFLRQSFNRILELIPLAEEVIKLTAVCAFCQNEAPFTARLGNETELEIIGGVDKYIAVCRKCYFLQKKKKMISCKYLNQFCM